ncbi:hypothetical protein FACS189411_16320 [Bacteroidia bacterium]|nr:hypothetical protein FACS189411_16320 [Bacteroidia bacterium]
MMMVCLAGHCQKNVDKLFQEFANLKDVDKMNVGKITFTIANMFGDTFGVEAVEVLNFNKCSDDVKTKFSEATQKLKDTAYETMINSSENGQRTRVLVQMKDDIINELVVVSTGNNPTLVRIKGRIKKSDLEKVMNEHH